MQYPLPEGAVECSLLEVDGDTLRALKAILEDNHNNYGTISKLWWSYAQRAYYLQTHDGSSFFIPLSRIVRMKQEDGFYSRFGEIPELNHF